jgi:hypothetical protein
MVCSFGSRARLHARHQGRPTIPANVTRAGRVFFLASGEGGKCLSRGVHGTIDIFRGTTWDIGDRVSCLGFHLV